MPYFLSRAMAVLLAGTTLFGPLATSEALGQSAIIRDMILNDPAAPVGGNPQGDVTIVAFVDYNCPFCKRSSKDLELVAKEDGNIRLIYKDWPVIAPTSLYGAQLAIASNYQEKYEIAHRALMAIPGFNISQEEMHEALSKAGIDMKRLNSDLVANAAEIDGLVRRNLSIGDTLSFAGTPVYLVGSYMTSTLDVDGFKKVVAAARSRTTSDTPSKQ
jgi:protein-disulfide isomerase